MASYSEAFRDLPQNLQHVVPLDFNSIQTVPESHAWLDSDDLESPENGQVLPVVDLAKPEAASLIGEAFAAWGGVVQVTNHGVPSDLLKEVESEARKLFSLPFSHKMKALRSAGSAGGYGRARISAFFDKYMWHEGFTIVGSPVQHAELLWPSDYQKFCDVMEEFQKKMKELATTLMRLIIKSLNIPEEKLSSIFTPEGNSGVLQLNSYPSCPNPNQAMGLAPHTDSSLFTMLHQADIGGLEVFKEGVGWVLVRPIPGVFVVNVGDILHILSNGKYTSALHRVVMKEPRHRLSVAYFFAPSNDFYLSSICTNSDEVPIYRSLPLKEYLGLKSKNLGKALSSIRI